MCVIGKETVRTIMLVRRALTMTMLFAAPEDLHRRLRRDARRIRGEPSALRLKCGQPRGGRVAPTTMREGVPNLPQQPGEEHQGSEQHSDTAGRPA